jgi:hypothetical protein
MSWSQIRFSLLSLQEETRSARTAFHLPPVAHAQGVPGFTLVLLVPLGHSCSLVIFPVRVSAARTLLLSAFFVSSPREGRSQCQCYRCLVLICSVAAATVRVIFPQLRSSVAPGGFNLHFLSASSSRRWIFCAKVLVFLCSIPWCTQLNQDIPFYYFLDLVRTIVGGCRSYS